MKKVFISYARKDDEAFAKRLYGDLTSRGFDVWWDREALHSRQLTFHQEIKDAIRCDVEKVVYVAGPAAYHSDYVREEWLFALECDLHVVPILRMGDYDSVPGELGMYHCHDFRNDEEYQAQMEKLTADLNSPSPPLGFLKAVPNLPPHFIDRPDIMKKLKDSLLIDLHRPSSSSPQVGIQGMGGLGKSVLAAAVARDREVRLSYPDGVVWLTFGQKPEVLSLMRNLLLLLGEKAEVQSILEAQTVLRELLLRKSVLIVLDDVWQASDAKHFDVIGPRCRLLITSRDAGIINNIRGELYALELFTEEEALKLLADSIGLIPSQLPEEAGKIVTECGCLPLAIALCGGMAKQSGGDWQYILKRLQDARLEKIADRNSINEQHISIWKAMQISVEAIGEDEQRRFAELSAFFTDRQIPVDSIATLWNFTGHIDQYDTKDLIIDLCARSLINYNTKLKTVSLHDLLYDYAYRTAGEPVEVQNKLLDAYHSKCVEGEWHQGPDDGYYYENLCPHFLAAGKADSAIALLTDIRWISAACAAGLAFNLVTDYQQVIAALPESQEELKREKLHREEVSRYTGSMIEYARKWSEARNLHAEDPEKYPLPDEGDIPLPKVIESTPPWSEERIETETERIVNNTTRLDRLRAYAQFVRGEVTALHQFGDRPGFVYQHAYNTAEYVPIVTSAKIEIDKDQKNTFLLKQFRNLDYNPFPALLGTFEGHQDKVTSVAITPDGKLAVSGSWDCMIKLWDIESGRCIKSLEGHTRDITSIAITPDGKVAVSGSWDRTIRVWNLQSGECLCTFRGHHRDIASVAITPDGKFVYSGGGDKTLQVWDVQYRKNLKSINGLSDYIKSIAITPDGKYAVLGHWDKKIRVLDLVGGKCSKFFEGHTNSVSSVAITPDKKLVVSGSWDNTIKLWDIENNTCLRTFLGHTSYVTSVAITPDRELIASGSKDTTVRLWDVKSGNCLKILEANTQDVDSVSITTDGKLVVSGSKDKSLRVWDLERGSDISTIEGHTQNVSSLAMAPTVRKVISGSYDSNLKVWNYDNGKCMNKMEGHFRDISSVAITSDGNLAVSGSWDYTLGVWDLQRGKSLFTLEGHTDVVHCVAITADGKLAVSGSWDNTVRLWDIHNRKCLKVFNGHTRDITAIAITPDGKMVVSGSKDSTLRVWNIENFSYSKILEGHHSWIADLTLTPEGKRVVSGAGDSTIRIWDIESGQCLRTLRGHAGYISFVDVTPNGKFAISGGGDGTICIWDIERGSCFKRINGHAEEISSIAVTNDGKYFVSASWDKTLRIWELENGECKGITKLYSPSKAVLYCSLKKSLIVGEETGEVSFFALTNFVSGSQILTSEIPTEYNNVANKKTGYSRISIAPLYQIRKILSRVHIASRILNVKSDTNITALCQQCGTRFPIKESSVTVIQGIQQKYGDAENLSENFGIPDAVRKDPGLKGHCPHCTAPYILNPFIFNFKPKYDD